MSASASSTVSYASAVKSSTDVPSSEPGVIEPSEVVIESVSESSTGDQSTPPAPRRRNRGWSVVGINSSSEKDGSTPDATVNTNAAGGSWFWPKRASIHGAMKGFEAEAGASFEGGAAYSGLDMDSGSRRTSGSGQATQEDDSSAKSAGRRSGTLGRTEHGDGGGVEVVESVSGGLAVPATTSSRKSWLPLRSASTASASNAEDSLARIGENVGATTTVTGQQPTVKQNRSRAWTLKLTSSSSATSATVTPSPSIDNLPVVDDTSSSQPSVSQEKNESKEKRTRPRSRKSSDSAGHTSEPFEGGDPAPPVPNIINSKFWTSRTAGTSVAALEIEKGSIEALAASIGDDTDSAGLLHDARNRY
ncbi:hypothetical protein HDU67_004849 [Dinochytrium kinnereticum]|nr:hypothetical protein HDU67_004849 [Dinochytrium kinnereticum]